MTDPAIRQRFPKEIRGTRCGEANLSVGRRLGQGACPRCEHQRPRTRTRRISSGRRHSIWDPRSGGQRLGMDFDGSGEGGGDHHTRRAPLGDAAQMILPKNEKKVRCVRATEHAAPSRMTAVLGAWNVVADSVSPAARLPLPPESDQQRIGLRNDAQPQSSPAAKSANPCPYPRAGNDNSSEHRIQPALRAR